MNIHLENVDLKSTTGPNHFASKLIKYMSRDNITFDSKLKPDARLCFIETRNHDDKTPLIQRLDGIYFNTTQNYMLQNMNISKTYENSSGVVYQTDFNKDLITKYFGTHENSTVIRNGADLDFIKSIKPVENKAFDKYDNIWCCASSWRPHKRLEDNIRYFLEHSSSKDLLVVAGHVEIKKYKNDRIAYVGQLSIDQLVSLYKKSNYFLHLAWLDHCPNVVVDARASGCKIVCSSSGGTKEIAGLEAVVIEEEEWDFEPVDLYNPPKLDFNKKIENKFDSELCMTKVGRQYKKFVADTLNENFYS